MYNEIEFTNLYRRLRNKVQQDIEESVEQSEIELEKEDDIQKQPESESKEPVSEQVKKLQCKKCGTLFESTSLTCPQCKSDFVARVDEKKTKKATRGDAIFKDTDKSVLDNADHFPINSVSQARNALARVAQYKSTPKWYSGSLKTLRKKVIKAVKAKYPSIKVSESVEEENKTEAKDSYTWEEFRKLPFIQVIRIAKDKGMDTKFKNKNMQAIRKEVFDKLFAVKEGKVPNVNDPNQENVIRQLIESSEDADSFIEELKSQLIKAEAIAGELYSFFKREHLAAVESEKMLKLQQDIEAVKDSATDLQSQIKDMYDTANEGKVPNVDDSEEKVIKALTEEDDDEDDEFEIPPAKEIPDAEDIPDAEELNDAPEIPDAPELEDAPELPDVDELPAEDEVSDIDDEPLQFEELTELANSSRKDLLPVTIFLQALVEGGFEQWFKMNPDPTKMNVGMILDALTALDTEAAKQLVGALETALVKYKDINYHEDELDTILDDLGAINPNIANIAVEAANELVTSVGNQPQDVEEPEIVEEEPGFDEEPELEESVNENEKKYTVVAKAIADKDKAQKLAQEFKGMVIEDDENKGKFAVVLADK